MCLRVWRRCVNTAFVVASCLETAFEVFLPFLWRSLKRLSAEKWQPSFRTYTAEKLAFTLRASLVWSYNGLLSGFKGPLQALPTQVPQADRFASKRAQGSCVRITHRSCLILCTSVFRLMSLFHLVHFRNASTRTSCALLATVGANSCNFSRYVTSANGCLV